MTAIERVLAIAGNEVGYLEKATNSNLDDLNANPGKNNYTKYARDLDRMGMYNFPKNGYAWCDIWCDWVYVTAFGMDLAREITGQEMKGCGAGCTESAQYYRNMGRLYKSDPQPGDQIFFTSNGGKTMYHTGLVERVADGRVYTIEGNTWVSNGVVAEGNGVARKSYSLDYYQIGGYGRPNWSLVDKEYEDAVIEEDEDMTQERFNEMMMEYRKSLRDNESGSWSEEDRQWAIQTGLVGGSGALPDGTPNYMWEDFLTREQAVALMHRLANMLQK